MCSREDLKEAIILQKDAVIQHIKWTVGTAIACTGLTITLLSFIITNSNDKTESSPQVIVVQQPVPIQSFDYWEIDHK